MTKESSPMMMTLRRIQETQVAYDGQEVGRRKGEEDVTVIWAVPDCRTPC